jgi:nucleoside-diphosphate-sugar epimerase
MKNYVMVTQASTEKSKRDLGFEAKVSLEEGIRKIYDYYLKLPLKD